jgi:DNA primase
MVNQIINEETKQLIQKKIDRLKLLEILGSIGVKEVNNGQIRGTCPIHKGDNTTSFSLFPDNNWSCFSHKCCDCRRQDLFSLVMKAKGVNFKEAAQFLSMLSGVQLSFTDAANPTLIHAHANDSWARYAHGKALYRKDGDSVEIDSETIRRFIQKRTNFMIDRGFNDDTLNDFEIGHCFQWKGLEEERVTFPVFWKDRYVGLQGRCIFGSGKSKDNSSDSWPRDKKYDNMADFIKTRYLYNYYRAVKYASLTGRIIITEGITDTMMLHQIGFRDVVSVFGSAISEDQIKYLCHGVWNVYVFFDNDKAGCEGFERFIAECKSLFNIFRITPPEGYDACNLDANHNYEIIFNAKKVI